MDITVDLTTITDTIMDIIMDIITPTDVLTYLGDIGGIGDTGIEAAVDAVDCLS